MKRLHFAAVLAGVCVAGATVNADHFRVRYKVQYSGGAYLGYPSSTTYSVNYYPMITPGGMGEGATPGAGMNGGTVYPRYVGPGYTVNGHPGPYTSYSYDYRQTTRYPGQGCDGCSNGSGGATVTNRVYSGGQVSRQPAPQQSGAPVQYSEEVIQGSPVNPPSTGVNVPKPIDAKPKTAPVDPRTTTPKSARRGNAGVPVLVADEQ